MTFDPQTVSSSPSFVLIAYENDHPTNMIHVGYSERPDSAATYSRVKEFLYSEGAQQHGFDFTITSSGTLKAIGNGWTVVSVPTLNSAI